MKSASTITKLSIVSVREGEQIASAKNLYVNRTSKKVEFLGVEQGPQGIFPSILSFKDILGIGNDYIVIQSADNIQKAYSSQTLISALEECLLLSGIRVLSSAGDIIGSIADYVVDEKTGAIAKLLLDNGLEIAGEKLVTLSAKFVVAEDGDAQPEGSQAAGLDEGSMAYLDGKKVQANVTSADGAFSVTKGTVLTKELIAEAAKHDALLLLTMEV